MNPDFVGNYRTYDWDNDYNSIRHAFYPDLFNEPSVVEDYKDNIGEINDLEKVKLCIELLQNNLFRLEGLNMRNYHEFLHYAQTAYNEASQVIDDFKGILSNRDNAMLELKQENEILKRNLENTQEKVRFLEKKINKLIIATQKK